jgi:hypothetical protein
MTTKYMRSAVLFWRSFQGDTFRRGEKLLAKHLQKISALILLICFTGCVSHEPAIRDIEGPPTMASSVAKAPVVSFCDLVRSPARYDKLIVRTQAIIHVDRENEFLYDPKCEHEIGGPVWADFDPSYVYNDEKLRQRLMELIRPRLSTPSRTARVTVVGRFEGPSGGPYGHLDGYPSRFSIMRVEQAEEAETMNVKGE